MGRRGRDQAYLNAEFIEALREALGLAPLYVSDTTPTGVRKPQLHEYEARARDRESYEQWRKRRREARV